MKDPVSFKLKNGAEVIVAENNGTGKVLAKRAFGEWKENSSSELTK
ncbi:hypothetical protein SAMN05421820_103540 [Pedobacter steynii]|uniref:Uncharacterized protein n=1 Tax=Pedobacter steynii TaxID=430522 RepID=A0A1G9SDH1_9SPHI|nr:hypothetical protein [Pedobacter steynii]NQX37476.1 hypothetical protein [Pedobacter steynii]SDM32845.1 hypothetical protein SAMN05421820_103540 [Pedobacter steynii]